MTTVVQTAGEPHPRHTALYVALTAVFVALAVISVFTYSSKRETAEAKDKAAQVVLKWEQAGLPVPANNRLLVRVLGTDGGALCTTTGESLPKALLAQQLANGAAGPGQRPVIVDRAAVATGARAIVEVYCPERLAAFDDFVAGLSFDDVVRG